MTIARLAATYGAIREAMEAYGKSRSRIACDTLTSATPTMTIARLAATYGAIREAMEAYGKSRPRIACDTLTSIMRTMTKWYDTGRYGNLWEVAGRYRYLLEASIPHKQDILTRPSQ